MSYDLFVFDPIFAPRDRAEFLFWYREVARWSEDRDYSSPENMTGNLRRFYNQMKTTFPPLNGPQAARPGGAQIGKADTAPKSFFAKFLRQTRKEVVEAVIVDEALVTDYSFASNAIYLAFNWSVSAMAYNRTVNAALSNGVGFFDVSAEDGVILHDRAQIEALMGL